MAEVAKPLRRKSTHRTNQEEETRVSRRREACRINQLRYVERKKQYEAAVRQNVAELKEKITLRVEQNDSLRWSMPSPTTCFNRYAFRKSIASMYASAIVRVASSSQGKLCDHQGFASENYFGENVHVVFGLKSSLSGRRHVLGHWQWICRAQPVMNCNSYKMEAAAETADIIQLSFSCTLLIDEKISQLYPLFVEHPEKLDDLKGKRLHVNLIHTLFFCSDNKVELLIVELHDTLAWTTSGLNLSDCALVEISDLQVADSEETRAL